MNTNLNFMCKTLNEESGVIRERTTQVKDLRLLVLLAAFSAYKFCWQAIC